MQYTAGELAKLLGVSPRTIRFYDEKNLLTPCAYSGAGYRLYDEQSVQRLQKIIMLKFMNFSLEQIAGIMQNEGFDRIMANHILFRLSKDSRLQLYPKIQALLAKGGRFSCSLIGKNHMKDLHEFIDEYYPNVGFPSEKFDILLETAEEELKNYFKVIKVEKQENDLFENQRVTRIMEVKNHGKRLFWKHTYTRTVQSSCKSK